VEAVRVVLALKTMDIYACDVLALKLLLSHGKVMFTSIGYCFGKLGER
jgi:hypothetical protein